MIRTEPDCSGYQLLGRYLSTLTGLPAGFVQPEPTARDDLSLACSDHSVTRAPQQGQTLPVCLFAATLIHSPIRSVSHSLPRPWGRGRSTCGTRYRLPNQRLSKVRRTAAPLRGLTPSGSKHSMRSLPRKLAFTKHPVSYRSLAAAIFMSTVSRSSFQVRYVSCG